MDTIEFSYTGRERIRCALQPKNSNGPSMISFVAFFAVAEMVFEIVYPGGKVEGLEFLDWGTRLLTVSIVLFLVYEAYKAAEGYRGERTFSFENEQITLSILGQSICMTKLKQFGLISPYWFLLRSADGTAFLIPQRIFASPAQQARFKKCGENMLANAKHQALASRGGIGGVAT